MKIVLTSSHKTYSKENTKNYTTNSHTLVSLINVKSIWQWKAEWMLFV